IPPVVEKPASDVVESPAVPAGTVKNPVEQAVRTLPETDKPAAQSPAPASVPEKAMAVQLPAPAEHFQMLAASGLEALKMATGNGVKSGMPFAPALDSPDVTVYGGGSTVLKSGISQKVSQVDLTIGK